eukprot:m.56136 g.56136  ORF g.56136 m.56136 type:complete len:506 (+) comp18714_c0_seq2:100-1617(+)
MAFEVNTEAAPLLSSGLNPGPYKKYWVSRRYALGWLGFFGFFNVYALRVNLSVASVKMASHFNWSSQTKGTVLSAFFYGYICTQLAGGWFATRVGAKYVYGFGVLTTTVLTLLTPVCAEKTWLLILLRIIEGFGEGVTYPAMHAMWAKWAPPLERSRLCALSYSGAYLGTVFSLPISGYLAGSHFLGGWPSVFYVFGVVGCLWFVFWMIFASSSPATHPSICDEEREYIETTIREAQKDEQHIPTPWLAMAQSLPLWGLTIMHFCQNWGFYTLLTCLPTFLNDVLRFSIQDSGLKASIPYVALFVIALLAGKVADYLRETHILSTGAVRKLFNTVAYVFTAFFLVATGYTNSATIAVLFLTIAQGMNGLAMAGFNINHLDIAPRFGGVLMGITNMVATVPGFVAPTLAGILAPCALCSDKKNSWDGHYFEGPNQCPPSDKPVPHDYKPCKVSDARSQWRFVFWISAGIFMFGTIFFLVTSSGKVQWWNDGEAARPSKKKKRLTVQ